MIVCFPLEGIGQESMALAQIMVASVRKHMPFATIVQHCGSVCPGVPGVDRVERRVIPGDFVERRWTHMHEMMQLADEPVLSLDYDVVVRRNLEYVFEDDFDVAMCRTPDRRDTPYNAGVIFLRPHGASFWAEVLDAYRNNTGRDGWEDSQKALTIAADHTALHVRMLNFFVYNFTPDREGTDRSGAALVHYRGRRKRFMAKDNLELLHG